MQSNTTEERHKRQPNRKAVNYYKVKWEDRKKQSKQKAP